MYDKDSEYRNNNTITREEIIQHIVKFSNEDPIVSTTGKASRELFETRILNNQSHKYDFLNVGSMVHNSSIALGIAINKPKTRACSHKIKMQSFEHNFGDNKAKFCRILSYCKKF